MDLRTQMRMPPRTSTAEGAERRVGVEIEFGAISAEAGARLVQDLFGGRIEEKDPHRFDITGTQFGKFTSELDTRYAHGPAAETAPADADQGDLLGEFMTSFGSEVRRLYGDISSLVVPCEIVCPPIALSKLTRLEAIVGALRAAGAAGTRSSPFYAFGAQLNPEIATTDPAWLTAVLKAYLLLSDWLRAVTQVDTSRRLIAFVDPFPGQYVSETVDPGYWPVLPDLMHDYLAANPTRNRELDMLPLFAWLDKALVRTYVDDDRIKPRPAFHYRLPDANLGALDWGLVIEWNRWCVVERLAERRDALDAMGASYRANEQRYFREDWMVKTSEWLALL